MELMTAIKTMPPVQTHQDLILVNAGQATLEMGDIVQVRAGDVYVRLTVNLC